MSGTSFLFEGDMTEDGTAVVSNVLSVFISGHGIVVRKPTDSMFRGKELSLRPFYPTMFSGTAIRRGYRLSMEGNDLGGYCNGPLGHPADGEFEMWDITSASISGNYKKEGLDIAIAAGTGHGIEICCIAKEDSGPKFPPLDLAVKFHVPKDKLLDFMGLKEGKYFWDMLNAAVSQGR